METNKIEKKREIGEKLSLQYCLQQHLQQEICSEISAVSHFVLNLFSFVSLIRLVMMVISWCMMSIIIFNFTMKGRLQSAVLPAASLARDLLFLIFHFVLNLCSFFWSRQVSLISLISSCLQYCLQHLICAISQFLILSSIFFPFVLIFLSDFDYFYRDVYLLVRDDNDIDNDEW